MNHLTLHPTPLAGLFEISRRRMEDERGAFARLFCARELAEYGFAEPVAQVNHSYTRHSGTIRGLHFQHPPHAETKLVTCVRGSVFDVAVDLRRGSPTFLRWHAVRLSALNHNSVLIPPGFAHGFQTLEDDCELIYLHSAAHAPDAEGGVGPLDPALRIEWPRPMTTCSPRDRGHPPITAGFTGLDR
ncbi:dTDP-4-dehydrorhamnose 3,5-epimerase family protein [Ralstonia insidiosa]|uniref:dTDP-4-dehydrorhamnose 3,5-epimerase n=1 Tax=Ralstonia insidiosa TaxID=190721 RepID=A0A848P3S9_9RALS|nr:dTDP-4-dehydrorhamnose 3,5-epimerase family protein [Ralstonia insidiosa]NMV39284.1 dTDP-4-keto-6-deoxy-D-glucose epimerase [Ralstonia insidiosa]